MNEDQKVPIHPLPTGVPGLDAVLGGGLPEYSFNMLAGSPGTGKTTLAQQIMFANATPERPALHFTVLGEPPLKMLRYQQQFSFFDSDRVGGAVRYLNLGQDVLEKELEQVLERITGEIERANPSIVVVDSFRTIVRARPGASDMDLQNFVQRLSLFLTTWQATTFMIGEYAESEVCDNPVFTVADGIFWMSQAVDRNSVVRKLQTVKVRGQASMPGLHTFRITGDGVRVFPRLLPRPERKEPRPVERLSTGVAGVDEMTGGGIPAGDSVLVAGPAGAGKTTLATQFIAEGARRGEPGVIAVFEEHPEDYVSRAREFGLELDEMIRQGVLHVMYMRPLDLSVDEIFQELRDSVSRLGARRVVIDSLSGFEIALAPTFREDFRESLYRLVASLTGIGVTVLMTVEVTEAFTELHLSPHAISFLTDDIILQRYVEMEGQIRRVMMVAKMRRSPHSKELRAYEVTPDGLAVGEALHEYRGIITGVPQRREAAGRPVYPGLTDGEEAVLRALIRDGESPAEAVAERTRLPSGEVERALGRLTALHYAVGRERDGKTVYRPVARALGQ